MVNTAECSVIDACPKGCGSVSRHRRTCEYCEADVGFPNVRYAMHEVGDLDARYQAAYDVAKARGVESQVVQLDQELRQSNAVMVRNVLDVTALLSNNSRLWATFAKQMQADIRVAENNDWDEGRTAAESAIHPNYHEQIHYAALSLDQYGTLDPTYGQCHLLLKPETYIDRATVFEENAFHFMRRHSVIAGSRIPRGYRAIWQDRHKLGVCKLSPLIDAAEKEVDCNKLLKSGNDKSADFIEVHIYGSIHSKAFEKITLIASSVSGSERALLVAAAQKNGTSLDIS
jgi:hypothetical protein